MCKYCSALAELRRSDLTRYQHTLDKYKKQLRKDDLLLKRCLIAISWKKETELINDILKEIGGEENDT